MTTPTTEPVIVETGEPALVVPVDTVCYWNEQYGIGSTELYFRPCDPATWTGEVRIVPEVTNPTTAVVAAPTHLPETGSEGTFAFIGTAALLLGLICTRIARKATTS